MRCVRSIFLYCFPILFLLFCSSSSASAYSFGDVNSLSFSRSTSATAVNSNSRVYVYYNPGQPLTKRNFVSIDDNVYNSGGVSIFNNNPSAGYINTIELNPVGNIPAHSMFSFTLRYAGLNNASLRYNGFTTDGQWTLLADSCTQSASSQLNSSTQTTSYAVDFNCTYYGYTDDGITSSNFLRMSGYIVNFEIGGVMVVENGLSYVVVNTESGGSGSIDTTQMATDVNTILLTLRQNNIINADIYYDMEDIITLLEDLQDGQLTQQNIQTAQENALQTEREAQEDILQDAQDDAESDALDSQDDVDSATTSLLSVLTQFLSVLTSASPTNCVIDGNLVPHLPIGSLDLCANSPPQALTALGSLILIVFIVPFCYSTVKDIVNLIGEFQR